MKKIIVIIILCFFCENINLLNAQNSKVTLNVAKKKSSLTQDLNKLETEKIKSISLNNIQKKDSVKHIEKLDTNKVAKKIITITGIKNPDSILIKNIAIEVVKKGDSIKISNIFDSILIPKTHLINIKSDSVTNTLPNNKSVVVEKVSLKDSILNVSYIKQVDFADSIRNANKYWLDSTLINLPKNKPVVINKDDEIEIFVSGGGFYAGVNAKIFDRLTIYHTGLVQREFKTKLQGEQVEEKMLSKEELRKLAQYIIDMGFFTFDNLYECKEKDYDCNTRMKFKPEPVPLNVSIVVGARRKKIYVSFFAPKIEPNFVGYPTALEKIVEAIFGVITNLK